MIARITKFLSEHKPIFLISILILAVGGYFISKSFKGNSQSVRYVLAAVEKGTLITSVAGSGQVSVSSQVDIKPKVSGDVVYVAVKNGQEVRAGALLVQLDARNAQKAIRDAQINLENAQISLSKLQISQKSNRPKIQDTINTAQNSLGQAYQNGFGEVANTFLDLPDILNGIRGIIYDSTVGARGQANSGAYKDLTDQYSIFTVTTMINQSAADYLASSAKYNANLDDYKNTTRYSEPEQISSLINETLETAKTMAQAVKDEQNMLDTIVKGLQSLRPVPLGITQYQSDIAGYISKLNNHITSLTNIQNSITSNQQSLAGAQRDLSASKQNEPLDLASEENNLKQRQAALEDAQDNLADYYIRAPFDGIIAKVNVNKGDSVSGPVATIIAKQSLAQISLNEVDVAKIKTGQKATLTFDAIPDLTITGEVLEIDTLGTVNQGVVTYNVKIGFDTQNQRIKSGMSVSAAIITDVKQNALLIPNSAIKTSGRTHYVEIPSNMALANQLLANASNAVTAGVVLTPTPNRATIELGLSNDSSTEILSGLKEGDLVVIRTITPLAGNAPTTQSRSLFSVPGAGGRSQIGR